MLSNARFYLGGGSPKVNLGRGYHLAFSPDGKTLVTLGQYWSKVLWWDVGLDSLVAEACRTANRNLTCSEWQQFMGNKPYRKTCDTLPGPSKACR